MQRKIVLVTLAGGTLLAGAFLWRKEPRAPLPARSLSERREALYSRVDTTFASAFLLKPTESGLSGLPRHLSPLLLLNHRGGKSDLGRVVEFGTVALDGHKLNVTAASPTIYTGTSTARLRGKELVQHYYLWWHRSTESSRWETQGFRMTVDERSNPLIWEVLRDSTGLLPIYVSESLERAAHEEHGPPLPDRRFAIERSVEEEPTVVVPRVLSEGPVPMGPFLYLRSVTQDVATALCRCMVSQVDVALDAPRFELKPFASSNTPSAPPATWFPPPPVNGPRVRGSSPREAPEWLEQCLRLPSTLE